jgi:hypothetical protein
MRLLCNVFSLNMLEGVEFKHLIFFGSHDDAKMDVHLWICFTGCER